MKICVIGLGYIGLPLSYSLAKKFNVTGYDHDKNKILQLKKNKDYTGEISNNKLSKDQLYFTSQTNKLNNFDVYIIFKHNIS